MFRLMPAAVLFLALFTVFWAGCSNDEPVGPNGEGSAIDLMAIISNPLAPTPGQTTQLTAQVSGTGSGASYEWEVEGGTLSSNDDITVMWEAPTTPGIYRVFVRASVGTAVDTMSKYVMVRNVSIIDTGLRYTLYPNVIGSTLYFIGAALGMSDDNFLGFHAYSINDPSSPIDNISSITVDGGYEFTFYEEALLTSSITLGAERYRLQPMNVFVFPLLGGSAKAVSNNEHTGSLSTARMNQNLHPSASSDQSMVVWQHVKAGTARDGTDDLTNIKFRFGTTSTEVLTSSKDSTLYHGIYMYSYYRNIKPMITPDELAIVYFTDSTGTYEPCVIPLDGSEPVTTMQHAIMVDGNHGIFYYRGVTIGENTVFQWNPTIPTQVGFIDNQKNFCLFDYHAETIEIVSNVGRLDEFVWDETGKMAAVNESGVIVVTPGGEPDTVFVKERFSDDVIGLNWSPGTDNKRLGFRVVRKGSSVTESFSALVIYSPADGIWCYASPMIRPPMGNEPSLSYPLLRVAFDDSGGMYAPVPISGSGGSIKLYYSH
ncbi:MAG: PKD domain-containing protein [Candidatus Krumholzibacteria bacterium]|nr:PKD domain-containing protein [Candidatus Krumholzibacteria bacterium]